MSFIRYGYQIEQIRLIDEYGADDLLSMQDNNTSCFNYRTIAGTNKISMHGRGLAIDINPFFNPYVTYKNGLAARISQGAESYADRSQSFAFKIDENDLCYKLFTAHGFQWGGNWNYSKDYQHFEKSLNIPSHPNGSICGVLSHLLSDKRSYRMQTKQYTKAAGHAGSARSPVPAVGNDFSQILFFLCLQYIPCLYHRCTAIFFIVHAHPSGIHRQIHI